MKNNRIAVFTNGFSHEFIKYMLEGLKEKAKIDGIDIFTFVSYCTAIDDTRQNECQLNIFKLPNPKTFDGAIIFSNTFSSPVEQNAAFAAFKDSGVPVISMEVEVPGYSCIKSENYSGIHELAEHLIKDHNVKKIVYVAGIQGNEENAIRRQALIDVLDIHGLSLYDEMQCDFSFYNPFSQLTRLLADGYELPDAFVCANDMMALGINVALTNAGYNAPEDVIITGFDMVSEGQYTFPILATVSRGWKKFGEYAYNKLMWQIDNPDKIDVEVHDSFFIPSESCGCPPSKDSINYRFKKIRNMYFESVQLSMIDIFFQRLRLAVSNVERKEQFGEKGKKDLSDEILVGRDYCICTEPAFFDIEDAEYTKIINGYSQKMDVLFENRDSQAVSIYSFDKSEIYPGYTHIEGESHHYIFAPFNYNDFLIGYVGIKDNEKMLYNQSFRGWVMNMNTVFFNMRRYVFAQRNNRRLQEIYMTDALTGMYNRTGCETVLYEFIKERKQDGKLSILAFADIDRMKTINDVYGHLNGDLAIKATSDAFRKFSPIDWMFGRYGGDEFIAVGSINEGDDILNIISEISDSMSEYFKSLNLSFMLHASIGYTIISPNDNGGIDDYIKMADDSMYKEKEKMHALIDSMQI